MSYNQRLNQFSMCRKIGKFLALVRDIDVDLLWIKRFASAVCRNLSSKLVLSVCVGLGLWHVLDRKALAQEERHRDARALDVLDKTIEKAGGRRSIMSTETISEDGIITYHSHGTDETQGNVSVQGQGIDHIRITADLPNGKSLIITNGYGGVEIDPEGKRTSIHGASAVDFGYLPMPYRMLIEALDEPNTDITGGNLVQHDGISAYAIHFQKTFTKQQDPRGMRALKEARDVFIDSKTLLLMAVVDHLFLSAASQAGLEHEVKYTNYKDSSGLLFPFTIEQTVGASNGFTIDIKDVDLNSSVKANAFTW